ncbi:thioesterase family protein [Streptacidiphilus sp. PB12-B1b]|uniref:thioesterase family protein n=1 Tax=Streptacidiphilus sp. PB12-B1b TaxID=2705012 RepID=UPI0015FB0C6E|nr:thioesterase family protein [Streptacidiphilus sp. PB12-B1b]QMU76796.1 thioesterase family protein [Streptacidiphilus sp. PB12-B1b]
MTTTPAEFDRGTALTRREADPADPGTVFDTVLDPGWRIGGWINGGLLLALTGRALSQHLGEGTGHTDPFSVSSYYLSSSRPGPAEVRTTTVRTGRAMSTGTASLLQQGQDGAPVERLRVLATYGDLSAADGEVRTSATPPQMPPPDQCIGTEHAPASFRSQADLLGRIDLRLDPATVGWALGQPSGEGRVQGWLRFPDGRRPDPLALLFAADVLPPVTLDLGLDGWPLTLELTAHIRAAPAPGWLRVVHATRNLAGGLLEEDAEIWDDSGRLVAQSRQLAMLPPSDPATGPAHGTILA